MRTYRAGWWLGMIAVLVFGGGCEDKKAAPPTGSLPPIGTPITAPEVARVLGIWYCDVVVPTDQPVNCVKLFRQRGKEEPQWVGSGNFPGPVTRVRVYIRRDPQERLNFSVMTEQGSLELSKELEPDVHYIAPHPETVPAQPGDWLVFYGFSWSLRSRWDRQLEPDEVGFFLRLTQEEMPSP